MTPMTPEHRSAYWRANLRLVTVLLICWFTCSFGFGILLVHPLNAIMIGGYPLGLWFAQQGAIYCFILLIFIYALAMHWLDKKFEIPED